ncbi:hypothetical protein FRC10_001954, partial [Ceratobasidium sp. 414]
PMFNKRKRNSHHTEGNHPRRPRGDEDQAPAALPLVTNLGSNEAASGSRGIPFPTFFSGPY